MDCTGWTKFTHTTDELLTKVVLKGTAPDDPGDVLYLCPECLTDYRGGKTLYEQIKEQMGQMADEFSYYLDSYYAGVEHDILEKHLAKVRQTISNVDYA